MIEVAKEVFRNAEMAKQRLEDAMLRDIAAFGRANLGGSTSCHVWRHY